MAEARPWSSGGHRQEKWHGQVVSVAAAAERTAIPAALFVCGWRRRRRL